jgi:hypothetical protein
MKMNSTEEKNLAGCCGLYCALCPRYQSTAASKCPGCKILSLTISCKRYNCCVKKNGFETCAECEAFPCDRYDEFFDWDSFVTHRVCLPNIQQIKHQSLTKWLRQQSKKRQALENLLANYNEGRSCSFYCIAAALLPMPLIAKSVKQAKKTIAAERIATCNTKSRAKILRAAIQDFASKANIDLKLRHRGK